MINTLNWYLRRHPFLYKIRFLIISKKSSIQRIAGICYNNLNYKTDLPDLYFKINKLIFPTTEPVLSDFEKAKTIAVWLRNNIIGGPGLGLSSEKTLNKMIKGQGGVCSDFSQIFNNFCLLNDLRVREWGLKIKTNNSLLKGGHSFNEVYSKEFNKWILIDVSKSIIVQEKESSIKLSVLELFEFKKQKSEIVFCCFNQRREIDKKNDTDIYLAPESIPFLISNYCNSTYDSFLETLNFLPVSIIHGLIILLRKNYVFEFPENIS